MRVVVIEGDGALNDIRTRRAKEPVVRVEDSAGRPLAGSVVNFILPLGGPGGSFGGAEQSLTVTAGPDGKAVGSGFKPNSTPGPFRIRVTASNNGETAVASIAQTNVGPPAASSIMKKKSVWLAVIGGAVAAGALAATRGGKGTTGSAALPGSAAGGTTVSPGTPVFTPPR